MCIYPGGSAWACMLLAYCQWSDYFKWHTKNEPIGNIAAMFLSVLAKWPWPVPFTAENMVAILKKEAVKGKTRWHLCYFARCTLIIGSA